MIVKWKEGRRGWISWNEDTHRGKVKERGRGSGKTGQIEADCQ